MYQLVRLIALAYLRWRYNLQIKGFDHMPEEGSVILISNHTSWLDPLVLAVATKRPIAFMAKEELFRGPLITWFLKQLHAFPVQRGEGDRRALRSAQQILKKGGVLGLFPEGTRNDGELLPFQKGAALIALRAGAPVFPVGIVWNGKKTCVIMGTPMEIPLVTKINREEVSEISHQLEERVAALLKVGEDFPVMATNNKSRREA
jgi:1-acyl-sn-glycerol-3-phosphate acyltransferase